MKTKSSSFHSNMNRANKILYQTKLKIRGTNQYVQNALTEDKNTGHELRKVGSSLPMRYVKSYSSYDPQNNVQLNQSANIIQCMNFDHYTSENCLCSSCLCGRHLCKLHIVKPDLKKSTVYQNSFRKGKTVKNQRILKNQEIHSLPKVEMNSTYSFNFHNKETKSVVKQHPDDQLKFEGPAQNLTSYRTNFPGNRGKNPYVRPKDVYSSGHFPLKNKRSSYRESYNRFNDFKLTQSARINDQLRTGNKNLFRESFYQQKFKQPNPEDYSTNVKNIQKLQINPVYQHHFETSYGKEFIQNQSAICPAKVKLETQYKDFLTNKKEKFNENSDFKALSSSFHALSTAPYGQYL